MQDDLIQPMRELYNALQKIKIEELIEHKRLRKSPYNQATPILAIDDSITIKDALNKFKDDNITSASVCRYHHIIVRTEDNTSGTRCIYDFISIYDILVVIRLIPV
jgi:hypothetical protein